MIIASGMDRYVIDAISIEQLCYKTLIIFSLIFAVSETTTFYHIRFILGENMFFDKIKW